jgi:hypothetical protein
VQPSNAALVSTIKKETIMARELTAPTHPSKPTHQQIAERAYQIFLERGQPQGHDQEHWLEAEKQLLTQQAPSQKPARPQVAETPKPSVPAATRRGGMEARKQN